MIVKSVETKEDGKLCLKVLFTRDEFDAAINKIYLKNRSYITVPGFRKGKASRMVVEGVYGHDVFYEDAINALSPDAFEFAIKQEDIKAVGRPVVSEADISDDKELTLTIDTAVYPEVTLGQYKGLEAPMGKTEVSDEEISAELERLRLRNARQITVQRPAQNGDIAVIDFEGFLDEKPFEGGKGEGHSLTLGSGQFVPGFEEQVVGMSAGEEADINLRFPEKYKEGLAGRDVRFHVKVNEVKENELPELDDEFAKDISEFDTLDEFKADVHEKFAKNVAEKVKEKFNEELLKKAIANMSVVIPDAMIDEQQEIFMREYSQNVAMQGMTIDDYASMMGMDAETFYSAIRPTALRQVQAELLLSKVADLEGIEFSDDDVEKEYERLVELYKADAEVVKNAIGHDSLLRDLRLKRAAELIYESGIPVPPEPEDEQKYE